MTNVLDVDGLRTTFPLGDERIDVVDRVRFSVAPGETLALVGESGCGKSMTALSLMRLVPKPGRIEEGRITVGDTDVRALPVSRMRQLRGGRLAMIFQEPMTSLNPVQAVGTQVAEAIRLHADVSRAAAWSRVVELFAEVGIPDPDARAAAYPHQLSGGMKQRVMIAMALAAEPEVLIADEPTTALDVTIQAQILALLTRLQERRRMAILLITHDLGIVNEIADRVAVMYAGRIVEQGPRRAILGAPQHPYTRGLLRSMPAFVSPGERLEEIPGVVPPPLEWPSGCRFSNRCPRLLDGCAAIVPERLSMAGGHEVWCHAVEREGAPGVAESTDGPREPRR